MNNVNTGPDGPVFLPEDGTHGMMREKEGKQMNTMDADYMVVRVAPYNRHGRRHFAWRQKE
jgi:hypothetical protein